MEASVEKNRLCTHRIDFNYRNECLNRVIFEQLWFKFYFVVLWLASDINDAIENFRVQLYRLKISVIRGNPLEKYILF